MERQTKSYWIRQKPFPRWLTSRYPTSSVHSSELLDCHETELVEEHSGSGNNEHSDHDDEQSDDDNGKHCDNDNKNDVNSAKNSFGFTEVDFSIDLLTKQFENPPLNTEVLISSLNMEYQSFQDYVKEN